MDAGSTEAAVASAQEGQHLTSDSITDAAASAGSAEAGNAATSNNSEAPANAAGTSKPAMHANNNNNNQDSEVASSNPGEVDHPSGPIAAAASTTEVAASTAAAAPATMSSVRLPRASLGQAACLTRATLCYLFPESGYV